MFLSIHHSHVTASTETHKTRPRTLITIAPIR